MVPDLSGMLCAVTEEQRAGPFFQRLASAPREIAQTGVSGLVTTDIWAGSPAVVRGGGGGGFPMPVGYLATSQVSTHQMLVASHPRQL